jgi:hypothetical protein
MSRTGAIALVAAIALGTVSIAADASAHSPGRDNGRDNSAAHNPGRHPGSARIGSGQQRGGHVARGDIAIRHAGHRGGYAPSYGYQNGYGAPVYGYESSDDNSYGYDRGYVAEPGYAYGPGYGSRAVPCLPVPVPVIGCW